MTRRCATWARSCTARSSRTRPPTRSGSTTAHCSTPACSSHARASASRPPGAARPRACSAARTTSSTPVSTRSPRAPAAAPSSLRVDAALRERARVGRYAYVHERGRDFAAGVWVIDPVFMLDVIRERLDAAEADDTASPRDERYFAGAGLDEPRPEGGRRRGRRPPRAGARPPRRGRALEPRARPRPARRPARAVRRAAAGAEGDRLPPDRHPQRDVLAYGAGWTDPERQRPIGDSGRREPRAVDAIVDAELQTALAEPDPLRAIAGLVARWAAAFVLDPDGVTRTKALGTERMARRLGRCAARRRPPACARPSGTSSGRCSRPGSRTCIATLRDRRRRPQHRRPRRPPRRLEPRRPRPRRRPPDRNRSLDRRCPTPPHAASVRRREAE